MGNDGYRLQLRLLRTWQLRRDTEVLHVATRQQRLITRLSPSRAAASQRLRRGHNRCHG